MRAVQCLGGIAIPERWDEHGVRDECTADDTLPGILMGRTLMGDGVINLRRLRQAVGATGYEGPIEVEIFNQEIRDNADERLMSRIQRCFIEHV